VVVFVGPRKSEKVAQLVTVKFSLNDIVQAFLCTITNKLLQTNSFKKTHYPPSLLSDKQVTHIILVMNY
jgi:hypothetical protein